MKKFDPQKFFDSLYDENSPGWPVIVLDFNGVLDQYVGWRGKVETFEPAEGVREFLEALHTRCNTVIICSATMPIEVVEQWVIEHGFDDLIDYVTNHKTPAMCYVDDRGIQHNGDFAETLRLIDSFVPYWKRNVQPQD